MKAKERYRHVKKVTIISVIINFFLGLIKIIGGFLYNSHGLIADGFHSFSDLLTDGMVLVASKYGSQDADKNHPYGHQRIETATTLFLAMLLIIAGAGIAWDAIDTLIHNAEIRPDWLSLPIIIVSIIAKEALFHYTRYIGNHIQSELLITNAWHHRSDAASSIIVLAGIIASLSGFIYFDAIAAVLVALLIIKMGWDYGWNSVRELVDTAVEPEVLQQIKKTIESINGVDRIHQLRSRLMGGDIYIDVHILVSQQISVSEGHYIAQHVHQALVKKFDRVKDVTVHVDPEDDEVTCPSFHLPNRRQLEEKILVNLKKHIPEILYWNLHYLDGVLKIDIVLSDKFNKWQDLKNILLEIKKDEDEIHEFRLLCLKETI